MKELLRYCWKAFQDAGYRFWLPSSGLIGGLIGGSIFLVAIFFIF